MDKKYEVGNFLYQMRTERGYTQKELAALLGVTDKAVSKWETGAAAPRRAMLRQLSEILGCTQEELLEGKRIERPEPVRKAPPERIIPSYLTKTPKMQRDDARRERLLEGIYSLAGSRLMLISFLCRLTLVLLAPVAVFLAVKVVTSEQGPLGSGVNFILFLFFLIVMVISIVFLCAFWRCYQGGRTKDSARLSGGLVSLRVFAIISLVASCVSLLSNLFSGAITALSLFTSVFDIVYYAFVQKALLNLVLSVRERYFDDCASPAVPVLLFLRLGVSILSAFFPEAKIAVSLNAFAASASTALNIVSLLILFLFTLCTAILLTKHRKLCEALRAESFIDDNQRE